MARIVRLTESDLARIVRRVISEQPEGTKLGPEEWMTIPIGGNKYSISFYGKTGNVLKWSEAMWVGFAKPDTKKDDRGKDVPTGNVKISFYLKCGDKKFPNIRYEAVTDCNGKIISANKGYAFDDIPEGMKFNIMKGGTLFKSDLDGATFKRFIPLMGALTTGGAVTEFAGMFCKG